MINIENKDVIWKELYNQRLRRFTDRIGKRIYRNSSWCTCRDCVKVADEWLVVNDQNHATYLCDVEWDYASEWVILNYRDIK